VGIEKKEVALMVTKKAADKAKKKPVARKKLKIKKQVHEKTLAQIFKEQGVKPFDISENGKNWPKGADPEEFLEAIRSGRTNGK
jgi:hypothetical protein